MYLVYGSSIQQPCLLYDSMKVRVIACLLLNGWQKHIIFLRTFLQLSLIPHYTTLQKFAARINGTLLERIISSFILLLNINRYSLVQIHSSGFKTANASRYYTYKAKIQKKYVKLSVSAYVLLFQLVCIVKIRRAHTTKHDIIDFPPLVIKASEILPTNFCYSS